MTIITSSTKAANDTVTAANNNAQRLDDLIMAGDYATAGGTANVLTLSVDPQVVALVNGLKAKFKAASNNTDAVTININSIGAKSVKDVAGNDLAPMAITADGVYEIMYDSTLDYWILLNSLPANNLNNYTAGEAIDASSSPKAVYIKASDGKVYLTDADDTGEQLANFLGFVTLGQDVSADDAVYVQTSGVISGFSGLTIGSELSLASPGSSPSDITETDVITTTSNYVGNVGGNLYKKVFYIEPTDHMWVNSLTISEITKTGTPGDMRVTLMQVGGISGGDTAGQYFGQVGMIPLKEWTISSAESYPYSDYVLDIDMRFAKDRKYAILFEYTTASSGDYYNLSGTNSNSSYWKGGTTSSSPDWQWGTVYKVACTLDVEDSDTFAEGDVSSYFYDYKKPVARAISATALLLKDGINGTDENIMYNAAELNTWHEAKVDGTLFFKWTVPGGTAGALSLYLGEENGASSVISNAVLYGAGGNYGDRSGQTYKIKKGQWWNLTYTGAVTNYHVQFTPDNI